jgi:hypothetical protein
LEHVKKALEIDKLWRERKQAEEEKRNLVLRAVPGDISRAVDETAKFGSYREREILYRAVDAQERVDAKSRVAKEDSDRK